MARRMAALTDYLLIDVSNSFTKLAFASTKRIGHPIRVATADLTTRFVQGLLRRRKVRAIVISSVVPRKDRELRRAAGATKVVWLSARIRLGVGVKYPAPRTIGADRLANAAAVASLHTVPAIVVDFGTAVTFDIVDGKGTYVGGVIAPGLESMTNFLYQRTALLPKLSLREPRRAVGKSTI